MKLLRGVFRSPLLIVALLVVLIAVVAAVAPSIFLDHDPTKQNLTARLKPPGFEDASGNRYLLGTDNLGRDIFSMIVSGARAALLVGLGAVAIAVTIGVTIGLIAGYSEGRISGFLMRLADLQVAFPFFVLAVAIAGIVGPSYLLVLFIIGIGNWVPYARVLRSEILEIRTRDYVQAAQALGARTGRILLRHVLPSNLATIIVLASFTLATAIVMEAGLSFVGLGVPGRIQTWGRLLSIGRSYVATAWWISMFPGLALFSLVLSINLLGDHIREVTDPKLRNEA